MKKSNKGFTLVELLAVIVILAIIMIIAIPAVLQTMQSARQKTFKEYVTKVYTAAQNSYLSDTTLAGAGNGKGVDSIEVTDTKSPAEVRTCVGYDVATGLGLSSVGSYTGAVLVCPSNDMNGKINILVRLQDGNYNTNGWVNYTSKGENFELKNGVGSSYELGFTSSTETANRKFTLANAVVFAN
ncbi:MAG: prepilin-type N-terminal cleavage/methylation domain-containing protein [Bacilli bacterium]|nr:prepilin-type N-terminal cleavage/methylation domain-containing protein [Bacilli bacterium]